MISESSTEAGPLFIRINADLTVINNNLSSKCAIDVTDSFTVNANVWKCITYNPESKTIKIDISAQGSFPNGSVVITAPNTYEHGINTALLVGCCGMVRDSNNTYAVPIATFRNNNEISISYSQAITASQFGFSVVYSV